MRRFMNRAMALLLVVIMLLGVMPVAMAAVKSVSLPETALVALGQTITLEPTVEYDGAAPTLKWSSSDPFTARVDQNGVVTGEKVGTVTITVQAGLDDANTASCEVTVYDASLQAIEITGAPDSLTVGATAQLDIAVAPEGASKEVTWSSDKTDILTVSETGLVTAVAVGTARVTATSKVDSTKVDYVDIEVKAAEEPDAVYAITLDKDAVTLTLNAGAQSFHQFKATITKDGTEVTDATELAALKLTWKLEDGVTAVTINETGLVTAVEKTNSGPVTVTATITNPDTKKTASATAAVTVVENTVQIKQDNVSTTEAKYIFNPSLVDKDGKALSGVTNLKFTYELNGVANDKEITWAEAGGTSTGYGEHEVEITATAKVNGVEVMATKTVYLAFTATVNYAVVLKGSITEFDFDDTDLFSSVKINGVAANPANWYNACPMSLLLADGTTKDDVDKISLLGSAGSTVAELKFAMAGQPTQINAIEDVSIKAVHGITLKMKETGKFSFSYTLKSKNNVVLATGTCEVTGNAEGKITYETTYLKNLTFQYDDFKKYWDDADSTTGSLSYVTFGIDTNVPEFGNLYTTSGKTTAVNATHKFAASANSTKSYLDLDNVTYVPDAKKTVAYTVEIPFVAYGGTGDKVELPGTVVINLNTSSATITSRGQIFGSDANSISGIMAEDYKDNTGKEMGAVYFVLPVVEDGRLLYSSSDSYVRQMTRVDSKTPYYYVVDGDDSDKTTNKEIADLEKQDKCALNRVFFVPAAGKTGKITIAYVAYDADFGNKYEGKLVLQVNAKTASVVFKDITAKSYSWAADSADFLYYEGIANGDDKGNYNPKNSITRGDFMLMLYRAFLSDEYADYTVKSNFADVKEGTSTYSKETYHAVGVAKALGIAKGDGVNYNPKAAITREEAMTLIYRTLETVKLDLEYQSGKKATSFADYSKVSKWAQASISELIAHGIVAGDDKGNLNPKANITRAEMAVILHRVLTY